MVHEPSFLTLAAHEVRRLRSRSVAVRVSLSPAASNRKLERMGIVVLRSTTPCVAVSSLSSSDLLTVISIAVSPRVPASARSSARRLAQGLGMRGLLLLLFLVYQIGT